MTANETAREFWGKQQDFPHTIIIDDTQKTCITPERYPDMRNLLKAVAPIPQEGEIIDFGGGASTNLLLPHDTNRTHVFDFSPSLLAKSKVPPKNRHYMDIAEDPLPYELTGKFSYGIMSFVTRYLHPEQKPKAYANAFQALSPGSHFCVIDIETTNPDIALAAGQVEEFSSFEEERIIQKAGFEINHNIPLYFLDINATAVFIFAKKPK